MPLENPLLLFTLTNKLSESEEKEFNEQLMNQNFDRSKKVNLILIVSSLILLFIDFLYRKQGLWTFMPGYRYLFYTHVLMILATTVLFIFIRIYRGENPKYMKKSVMVFAYFVTLICTFTSIVDQYIHGEITVYIIGAYTIAVMNTFKPRTSLILYLINHAIFITGVILTQNDAVILRGHYVNGTILVVVAWTLSCILYTTKVRDFLSRKTIEKNKVELEKSNQLLTATNHKLQESLSALDETQNIIFTLALALESKDPYTHGHSDRIAESAVELARFLKLSEEDQVNIFRAAILHDLGKIGIPDAILNKPSSLTSEEWAIMKSHPERGAAICSKLTFAKEILPIIKYHHERYDGKGYPEGLSGESIPLMARIISVVDTADAMTSRRPYRSEGTFEYVLEELKNCAGTQFDPAIVDAFISLYKDQGNFDRILKQENI